MAAKYCIVLTTQTSSLLLQRNPRPAMPATHPAAGSPEPSDCLCAGYQGAVCFHAQQHSSSRRHLYHPTLSGVVQTVPTRHHPPRAAPPPARACRGLPTMFMPASCPFPASCEHSLWCRCLLHIGFLLNSALSLTPPPPFDLTGSCTPWPRCSHVPSRFAASPPRALLSGVRAPPGPTQDNFYACLSQ